MNRKVLIALFQIRVIICQTVSTAFILPQDQSMIEIWAKSVDPPLGQILHDLHGPIMDLQLMLDWRL